MREPARLNADTLQGSLRDHWGLTQASVGFLPLGNDSDSYTYRADASGGTRYFLKVRTDGAFREASLVVPRLLVDRGLRHIVAPLRTLGGDLWVRHEGYALSLQPFVPARCAADTGLTEEQWRMLGATLRGIHDTPPALVSPVVPRETWVPSRRELLPRLEAADAAIWREHHARIREVTELADALGRRLRAASPPHVLCHADFHTWNILRDPDDAVWIVDWDDAVIAPRERDLMFVVGGIGAGLVSPRETDCFLQGYGAAALDPLALAYYRAAWAVQDIAAYGERAFLTPGLTPESRREAAEGLGHLFDPGNIVELALGSEVPS